MRIDRGIEGSSSSGRVPAPQTHGLKMGRLASLLALVMLARLPVAVAQTIRVDITPGHATNSFTPTKALGAGIDRLPSAATDKLFVDSVLKPVLSAGWQTVSYRQNTELHIEAWHWNPQGTWSDPAGNRGYFTGSATPGEFLRHSHGYFLPHRGTTRNDGTETEGYSRLTDGDPNSYWKSNPYLAQAFTGEADALHPQWVIIDFASNQDINAIRIAWAEPYAKRYLVQYWTGEDPIKQPTKGMWVTFPQGSVTNGRGGSATLQLAASPVSAHYLRILMTESSNTCDTHGSSDRRNCVGYAIREVFIGTVSPGGAFHDVVRHTPDQDQTATYCSSVDPWHEASDINDRSDQVGFDLFFTSGFTRGLPAMVPVAVLYDVPENAAAEMAYLQKRGYPVSYVELGEEADGQYMLPEDYGALYLQWAAALHKVNPNLKLGGPAFQGVNKDIEVWADAEGKTSWLGRFLDYLKAHGRLADLAFFSFEHYPYEPCKIQWSNLYDEPGLVSHILQTWRDDGVPPGVPMFVTESNIAWSTGESFVDIFGALWLADYVASFLTAGGDAVYYFHYLPMGVHRGCNQSMGTFAMFSADANYVIQQPIAQFFSSQLLNLEWVQPGEGVHQIFPVDSDIRDPMAHVLVTAYAVHRPDGQWSLLLINKDQENAYPVRILFHDEKSLTDSSLSGPVNVITFGSEQYRWHPSEKGGFADPDGPAVRSTVAAAKDTTFNLPKASVTVIRGALAANSAQTRRAK